MSGHSTGDLVILTILNLNKQSRLYSQDYRPVSWCASQPEWQPLKLRVTYRREGDDFQLRFCHRFENEEETLFAFAIPFSYQQTQEMLDHLDQQLPFSQYGATSCGGADTREGALDSSCSSLEAGALGPAAAAPHVLRAPSPAGITAGVGAAVAAAADRLPAQGRTQPPPWCGGDACISSCSSSNGSSGGGSGGCSSSPCSQLYYRRQLLTRSMEGRRVELITITDRSGATGETEPRLPGVFEHDPGAPAAVFRDKTVFFVSSRVHPGETPATHIFNGMLAFLLRRSDPRAAALRRRFVFKLVPIVNPDGVAVGNYRTDTLGQNLNRFYSGVPDRKTQSSVYAIKALLMYYAQQGTLEYYIDLHAHANKKGVFIYGNTLEDSDAHMQSLMYSKLVALNNPAFDFVGCNYTEKNMIRPDKDGASKEGAGRVALYRETGLTHLYTIEANYNSARTLNVVAPASGDHGGRASPPCNKRFPPKFTTASFHGVGRAILIAALDMEGINPWSRLPLSEHRSLEGVRSWILTVLRATPETRAAHLPALSDMAVEKLRSMIASGALRVSPALTSFGRTRQCPSAHASAEPGAASAMGYASAIVSPSPVAFGRSISTSASSNARSRLPPPSVPSRRANASLPVLMAHSLPATSASGVAGRRGAVAGGARATSCEGLARSTSLPVKGPTQTLSSLSPRHSSAYPPALKDPAVDSAPDEAEDAELAFTAAETVTIDAASAHAEGPSDEDGDDESHDVATATTPGSSTAAATTRFRSLESPLRSPSTSFKGHTVYCGRVTEFKFPLTDGIPGTPPSTDGPSRIQADVGMRTAMMGAVHGPRPPSEASSRRPSTSDVLSTSGLSHTTFAAVLAAGGAVTPRNAAMPRALGSSGTVLITPELLAAVNAPRKISTLTFARSSSARRGE